MVVPCLFSVQLSEMALFAYCGQSLVSVLLMSQSEVSFGLSWVSSDIFQSFNHMKLQSALPVVSPEKFSLVGEACSQIRRLPTTGATVELVCVVIFFSPQVRSHFRVVLATIRVAVHACMYHACGTALNELLQRVCWIEQVLRRMGYGEFCES